MGKSKHNVAPNLFSRILYLCDYIQRKLRILAIIRINENISVSAEDATNSIENVKCILSAEDKASLNTNKNDQAFLDICKYYNDGTYKRPKIITFEVPGAICHIDSGLVCTKDYYAIYESQMEYRANSWVLREYRTYRPKKVKRLNGTYVTINNVFWYYWWHWLVDCLPRLYLISEAYPNQKFICLLPDNQGESFKESLYFSLPDNIEAKYMPKHSWVKVDRMVVPSYLSSQSNGHMPFKYYENVRQAVFKKLDLPLKNKPEDLLYISRSNDKHRRITNEEELFDLLCQYGFKMVFPETLSFAEQVKTFHKAKIIISPHGSNWANIIFSGRIKIIVLYPDKVPNTHIFTMAKALGQEHYFLAGNKLSEHSDFKVDILKVEELIDKKIGLLKTK